MGEAMTRKGDLLDPIEEEILRRYVGLRSRMDHELLLEPEPTPEGPSEDFDRDDEPHPRDARDGVRLKRAGLAEEDFPGDIRLANAVARICLNAIQEQLPDFAFFARDVFVRTRRRDTRRRGNFDLLPRFLFSINWADTGPGFSWPESYHVTFIPQHRRHIVTASVDSPDIWGCTDFALGWFRQTEERSASIRRVIRRWWSFRRQNHHQPKWEAFLAAGEVGAEDAERWCFKHWPDQY